MFSLTKQKKNSSWGGQDRTGISARKEGRLIKERRFTVQFIRFCFCEREREMLRVFFSSGIWLSENGLLVSEHNNRQAGRKRGNFPFDDCYNHISTFVTYPSVASPPLLKSSEGSYK